MTVDALPPQTAVLLDRWTGLAEAFAAAGRRIYVVGGSVRDLLLGAAADDQDYDFTTDALPAETKRIVAPLAEALWTQGERFGTIAAHVDGVLVEITTHRAEAYEPDSRKPNVAYSTDVTVDLSRRDFTINALAIELTTEVPTLIDPWGGVDDLRDGRLRTPLSPEESFSDDPLRMMRAARFLARFDLTAEPALLAAVDAMAARLDVVSTERVRDEFDKLLRLPDPDRGLRFLVDHGLASRFLPELTADTLDAVDWSLLRPDAELRLAALLTAGGCTDPAERLRSLRSSRSTIASVGRVVDGARTVIAHTGVWTPGDVRRLVHRRMEAVDDMLALADALGAAGSAGAVRMMIDQLSDHENLASMTVPLGGRDLMGELGVEPGPIVGDAMDALVAHRLEHGPLDRDAAFEFVRDWMATRAD